mmetsp:Transcript_6619/g.19165  ORF Transcript_6619/g.19165 Transcript_6619/m.19165 type:complete len:423 (+) Transcript_6619:1406-2674(+)
MCHCTRAAPHASAAAFHEIAHGVGLRLHVRLDAASALGAQRAQRRLLRRPTPPSCTPLVQHAAEAGQQQQQQPEDEQDVVERRRLRHHTFPAGGRRVALVVVERRLHLSLRGSGCGDGGGAEGEQEQGEGGGEAAAEPAAEGAGESLSAEHCCRGGEEGGAEEVGVLRAEDEGEEEKRLEWEEVERARQLLAAERVVRLPAELREVPLLRESEQGLPEVEGREEAVEVDQRAVGVDGVGQHLHDLVCEDHHEARRQVEDEDADLRSRVREEEVRVAVRERDRREAIQPQHERRRARLGRIADEAGLAVEAEDGHHSERDKGGHAGVPEVVGEPVDDGVGARDELQVLRLGVSLLDNEGRDGGGRVRERDEDEDAGEEGEHHLHLRRLRRRERQGMVVHPVVGVGRGGGGSAGGGGGGGLVVD